MDDEFYSGHEGGYRAEDILAVAERLDALQGAHFAGITTFPALLFDPATRAVRRTRNLETLERAASRLRDAGRTDASQRTGHHLVRSPGGLADAGVTQVEPGHALTGTTPWHASRGPARSAGRLLPQRDQPPVPGPRVLLRRRNVRRPGLPALSGPCDRRDPGRTHRCSTPPFPHRRHRLLRPTHLTEAAPVRTGDSVVFGFRIQAFVTRGYTAGVSGISTGTPHVEGIWSADGSPNNWPG